MLKLVYFRDKGDWLPGPLEGLLLSSSARLTHNVHIASNKAWTGKTTSNPPMDPTKPRDNAHGFCTISFYRALKSNIRKRLRKLNGDDEGEKKESEETEKGSLYMSEVNISLEPYDVVVNCPVISHVMKIFTVKPIPLTAEAKLHKLQQMSDPRPPAMPPSSPLPFINSGLLPLVNINTTNTRVFIPLCTNKPDHTQEKLGLTPEKELQSFRPIFVLGQDVIMLQMMCMSLTSEADNPLPRMVVERDLYRRAMHAGMTRSRGSEMEDRQYQLDIMGLSLCTGTWMVNIYSY